MKRPTAFPGHLILAAAALFLLMPLDAADEMNSVTAFAPEAAHLWNRTYAALAPPGTTGLGSFAARPATAEKLQRVLALLAEFAKGDAELKTMTPLQRAVMQRHLLLHFHAAVEREKEPDAGVKEAAQELIAMLVPAIRKIALTPDQIRKLPDLYARAIAQPDAVTAYDPGKPAPFLPKDLLTEDGPWIAIDLTPQGGRQGVVAELHFRLYRGTTSFEVRMRHPEGRAAGEAYWKQLAEMPDPFVKERTLEAERLRPNGPADAPLPNLQTPQFPRGTAWALIHRAILADSDGNPVVSPLVEGVQVRVYRALSAEEVSDSPDFKAEVAALEAQKQEFDRDLLVAQRFQTVFEWTMRGTQPLESKRFQLSATEETLFGEGRKGPLALTCLQCHVAPGIHSVNTRAGLFHEGRMGRPPEFQPATRVRLDEVTEEAARKMTGWSVLLQKWERGESRK